MSSITSPRRTLPSPPSHQQASLAFERRQRERRLYEASHDGCIESLAQLLQEDGLILARASITCFDETPLHVACMLGHVPFAKALLAHKRDLAMELDSQGRTPLHLASVNGYVEIAMELLQLEPRACLVHDEDGRTPLHLAMMKGRSNIVIELVNAKPEAAKHRLSHGQTIFHLGVSHNRLEALKVLVEMVRDDDLVKAQDDEGNTILHLATANKQIETVKYLLQRSKVGVNTENKNGFSALDIVEYFPKDFKVIELRELLVHAGAQRAIRFPASTTHQAPVEVVLPLSLSGEIGKHEEDKQKQGEDKRKQEEDKRKQDEDKRKELIKKKRDSLMITATVIAAMAYQACISPPGGVWDSDQTDNNGTILYNAGTSIMAAKDPEGYPMFWTYNTISFLASLSTIFLLISGFPFGEKALTRILTATMWVTIIFTALTYLRSMLAFSHVHRKPQDATRAPTQAPTQAPTHAPTGHRAISSTTVAVPFMFVFLCAVAILFLFHIVRCLRKIRKSPRSGDQPV